jgi:hypothetical protein
LIAAHLPKVDTKKEGFFRKIPKFFRRLLGGGWGAGGVSRRPSVSKILFKIGSNFV